MFRNLQTVERFREYNWNDSSGDLRREGDPTSDVAEAFRIRWPYRPDPYLLSTLSYTLSSACCSRFLASRDLPAIERDYYLSKLYQFLLGAFLDQSTDPEYFRTVPDTLTSLLDKAFPEGTPYLQNLCLLEWQRMFDDHVQYDMESITERITTYLPQAVERPPFSPREVSKCWIVDGWPDKLRSARTDKQQLLKEAADQCGCAVHTYRKWEAHTNPRRPAERNVPQILQYMGLK